MEKRKIRQVYTQEVFRLYMTEESNDFKWHISKASNDIITGRSVIVNESQFMGLYKQLKRPRRNPHKED